MTIRAAGILFKTKDDRALFLKRGPTGDFAGYWCLPGGKIEGDEPPEEAAKREAVEEVGSLPAGSRTLLTRSIQTFNEVPVGPPAGAAGAVGGEPLPVPTAPAPLSEAVDFSTFLQPVDAPFDAAPDQEHVGYAWAPVDAPPEPLHPGCRVSLARLSMDELGVARAMSRGELTSPQRYKNVMLWGMRITGTGVALRSAIKDAAGKIVREEEFPWRDPALYLNDEFLARCNGLAVVWIHPKKNILDSKSYAQSTVGAIMLPYLKGNEVWGIAKVYDDEANAEMQREQFSTSPGVMLSDPNSPSYKMRLEDGSTLLIEGKPSLVDHLAIIPLGVWDKGGEPSGVDVHELVVEQVVTDAVAPLLLRNKKLDRMLTKTRNIALDKAAERMSRFML